MSHNAALYHPTTRQLPPRVVLARCLCRPVWSPQSWRAWCAKLVAGDRRALRKAQLPLEAARRVQSRRVAAVAMKRPASACRAPALRKRTVFKLQRAASMLSGGVKSTVFRRPAACS
jgi:hypothetical protein